MTEHLINQRSQRVLKTLIERYIEEGQPVASKTVAEESSLGLSSATIRNILSSLEEEGYLASPHTSSGRIPTALGYRLFVDSLVSVKPFESEEVEHLKKQMDQDLNFPDLLHCTSSILSGLTQLIGVVALPRPNRMILKQVEFLPLSTLDDSTHRVLVILVLSDREIQNRVISTDRFYNASELQRAANYINTHYAGRELLDIRNEISESLQNDRKDIEEFIKTAISMANKAFTAEKEKEMDCVIAGQANLFNYNHEMDMNQLRNLFEAFTHKQDMLNLLSHAILAEGIQIFIGKESGYEALNDWSIVTMPYSAEGKIIGSLGVIGPLRMPYERVISAVDITSKLLSAVLNQGI